MAVNNNLSLDSMMAVAQAKDAQRRSAEAAQKSQQQQAQQTQQGQQQQGTQGAQTQPGATATPGAQPAAQGPAATPDVAAAAARNTEAGQKWGDFRAVNAPQGAETNLSDSQRQALYSNLGDAPSGPALAQATVNGALEAQGRGEQFQVLSEQQVQQATTQLKQADTALAAQQGVVAQRRQEIDGQVRSLEALPTRTVPQDALLAGKKGQSQVLAGAEQMLQAQRGVVGAAAKAISDGVATEGESRALETARGAIAQSGTMLSAMDAQATQLVQNAERAGATVPTATTPAATTPAATTPAATTPAATTTAGKGTTPSATTPAATTPAATTPAGKGTTPSATTPAATTPAATTPAATTPAATTPAGKGTTPSATTPAAPPAASAPSSTSSAAPAGPAAPAGESSVARTVAANPNIRTNQDLVNHYYRQGGGTWEGASRLARADGTSLNQLIRNRQGAVGSDAPASPSNAPAASTTPNAPASSSEQPGRTRTPTTEAPNAPANQPAAGAPPNGTARTTSTSRTGQRNQMTSGQITINGNTYQYNSGGNGNGNLPPGQYTVTPFRNTTNQAGMVRDGVGYSFALTDKHDTRTGRDRSLLRIHPDGGNAGTLGCIGIVGDAATQRRFRDDMNAELRRNNGRYTLNVQGGG